MKEDSMAKLKRSHRFALLVGLSLALIWGSSIPGIMWLGRILLLFSTLFHELGHALAAVLTGGHVESVNIYWDASGLTTTRTTGGPFTRALVMAGGLLGPSFAAAGLFWAARAKNSRLYAATKVLSLVLIFTGCLTARSLWSIIFTIGLGVALLACTKLKRSSLETLIVFIAVQLGISVFTRSDYLFTRWAGPGLPSDVAQIASALWLPYWFWGFLCGAASLGVLFWGYRCYTKPS